MPRPSPNPKAVKAVASKLPWSVPYDGAYGYANPGGKFSVTVKVEGYDASTVAEAVHMIRQRLNMQSEVIEAAQALLDYLDDYGYLDEPKRGMAGLTGFTPRLRNALLAANTKPVSGGVYYEPCRECGREDLPLHTDYRCPNCHGESWVGQD